METLELTPLTHEEHQQKVLEATEKMPHISGTDKARIIEELRKKGKIK